MAVCTGTQNFLSTTGDSEIMYNLTKKMYTGCEIVMGNLEIAMMEQGWDFSFLRVSLCPSGQHRRAVSPPLRVASKRKESMPILLGHSSPPPS